MKKIIISDILKPVVDRDPDVLSRGEIRVFTAGAARELFDLHRTERADLIIADFEMEGMNGAELCGTIRKDDLLKKVAVILVCPNNEEALSRCRAAGANIVLSRPLNRQALFQKAMALLNVSEREGLRVLIKVSVKGKFKNEFFYAFSENISTSGILIETDTLLSRGDELSCSFFLRSDQISVEGDVARVTEKGPNLYQYGVCFRNIDRFAKTVIEEFVKNRKSS